MSGEALYLRTLALVKITINTNKFNNVPKTEQVIAPTTPNVELVSPIRIVTLVLFVVSVIFQNYLPFIDKNNIHLILSHM